MNKIIFQNKIGIIDLDGNLICTTTKIIEKNNGFLTWLDIVQETDKGNVDYFYIQALYDEMQKDSLYITQTILDNSKQDLSLIGGIRIICEKAINEIFPQGSSFKNYNLHTSELLIDGEMITLVNETHNTHRKSLEIKKEFEELTKSDDNFFHWSDDMSISEKQKNLIKILPYGLRCEINRYYGDPLKNGNDCTDSLKFKLVGYYKDDVVNNFIFENILSGKTVYSLIDDIKITQKEVNSINHILSDFYYKSNENTPPQTTLESIEEKDIENIASIYKDKFNKITTKMLEKDLKVVTRLDNERNLKSDKSSMDGIEKEYEQFKVNWIISGKSTPF